MTRFNLTLASVFSAAFLATSVPQAALAQFTSTDAAMQQRSQLYFATAGAISDLLQGSTAYSIARAHNDRTAMQIAASEMAAASSEAAFLAAVLDAEVQAEGTNATAKELAPQLATLTAQVESTLDSIVASGNLDELNKVLDSDETANALTELFRINKQVHQLLEG